MLSGSRPLSAVYHLFPTPSTAGRRCAFKSYIVSIFHKDMSGGLLNIPDCGEDLQLPPYSRKSNDTAACLHCTSKHIPAYSSRLAFCVCGVQCVVCSVFYVPQELQQCTKPPPIFLVPQASFAHCRDLQQRFLELFARCVPPPSLFVLLETTSLNHADGGLQ